METNNAEDEIESDYNIDPAKSNEYKIDPETEQRLLNVSQAKYDQKDLEKFEVRPWIDDFSKKPQIDIMTQFALYKCMHPECVYATDNEQHWESHMKKHIQMIDVLTKCYGEDFGKTIRNKHIKFRECPYCMHMAKSNFQVINHMAQHRRNAFQVCFPYPYFR